MKAVPGESVTPGAYRLFHVCCSFWKCFAMRMLSRLPVCRDCARPVSANSAESEVCWGFHWGDMMRLHVDILAVTHWCCGWARRVTVTFALFLKAKSKNNGTLVMGVINNIRIFSLQSLLRSLLPLNSLTSWQKSNGKAIILNLLENNIHGFQL